MNFHFAHIDWKMCRDTVRNGKVIPGFYDPAYPEVCRDRSNRRKVGFTLHAQWPNGGSDPLSMLVDFSSQIVAFRDQCNSTLLFDPPPGKADGKLCYLSVSFGTDPTMQRKIGWRKGLGMKSVPLSPPGQVSAAAKLAGGDSRDYQTQVYNFVIERESRDFKTVYARFSWEIEFDESNQYYTVFWEGCCRPAGLVNNAVIPFLSLHERFLPLAPVTKSSVILWRAGACLSRTYRGLCELGREHEFPVVVLQVHCSSGVNSEATRPGRVRTDLLQSGRLLHRLSHSRLPRAARVA